MKIVISKSQWELIGREAGWIKTARKTRTESFKREYDEINGDDFSQPGKSYFVSIKGDLTVVDDSDYSYPSGYGKYIYVDSVDVSDFEITEYDETGSETGNEISIQRDNPVLYSMLLEASKEWVKNDWNR